MSKNQGAEIMNDNETRQAMISILEYNWEDERNDYYENCSDDPDDNQRRGHIFESLIILAEFLGVDMEDEEDTGANETLSFAVPEKAAQFIRRFDKGEK